MSKWKWQALASVARALAASDHPYLAFGVIIVPVLSMPGAALVAALLR